MDILTAIMDQKYDAAYIEELAYKLKTGHISDEELACFNAWYAQQQEQDFHVVPEFAQDRDELHARIYMRIEQQISSRANKTTKVYLWKKWAIAAAVLVVVGMTGAYFLTLRSPVSHDVTQEIKPASNTATLTLADGSVISLGDLNDGMVVQTAAADIIKTADGELVYKVKDDQITNTALEYNTITAPAAGKWLVVLPDQSKVWLNASSSIRYPTRFAKNERLVTIQGEAYFSVTHQANVPFYVDCRDQRIRVLGTEFNVEAYANSGAIKTTLVNGSVAIQTLGKQIHLQPGEQATFSGEDLYKEQVDVDAAIAWKNGYFNFNNEPLTNVLAKVARWYDVEITYKTAADPSVVLTGKISNKKNLHSILRFIEYTSNMKCNIEGRRVIISK